MCGQQASPFCILTNGILALQYTQRKSKEVYTCNEDKEHTDDYPRRIPVISHTCALSPEEEHDFGVSYAALLVHAVPGSSGI